MVHGDRYADTQPGLWGPPVLTGVTSPHRRRSFYLLQKCSSTPDKAKTVLQRPAPHGQISRDLRRAQHPQSPVGPSHHPQGHGCPQGSPTQAGGDQLSPSSQ